MTIAEIKAKYPADTLFTVDAHKDIRRSLIESLFDNLYLSKVIYRIKVALLAEVDCFELSEEYFSVDLKLLQHIRGDSVRDYMFVASFKANKIVRIKCKWETIGFKGNSLCSSGYDSWFMVFAPNVVEKVEKFLLGGNSFEAADEVYNEIWPK